MRRRWRASAIRTMSPARPALPPLVRLLQLASPALPVGAYTYSQGLEWAVEAGIIHSEQSAGRWIGDLLRHGIGRYEAPLVAAVMNAWPEARPGDLARLNAGFLASRESAELRAETAQMGYSLRRLIQDLDDDSSAALLACCKELAEPAFPVVWALLAAAWDIPRPDAVAAYLWTWAENQVMAALKAVPLGQGAGQRLLLQIGSAIPALAESAMTLPECDWSNFNPGFALAATRHETQYSRLFRS